MTDDIERDHDDEDVPDSADLPDEVRNGDIGQEEPDA